MSTRMIRVYNSKLKHHYVLFDYWSCIWPVGNQYIAKVEFAKEPGGEICKASAMAETKSAAFDLLARLRKDLIGDEPGQ